MDRERRRAEQHQHIAEFQLQRGFGHAEQIKAHCTQEHADPHDRPHAFSHKNTDNRNESNIQGGDKARLADRRIHHAELLQAGRHEECRAAEQTADDGNLVFFPIKNLLRCAVCPCMLLAEHIDDRNQHQTADQGSDSIVGKRLDVIHAALLRHKGRAPDSRRNQQQNIASHFFTHQIYFLPH